MTYVKDGLIEAVDFNTFRTDLLQVYDVGFSDSGYGQIVSGFQPALPGPVSVSDIINSDEWDKFLDAADICTTHQGSSTSFPPNSEVAVDEIVEAHESDAPTSNPFDINGSLVTLDANRLIVAGGQTGLFQFGPSPTDLRAVAWSVQLIHQFRAIFPVVDDARYFFNSGGEIRLTGTRTGGSLTPQNTAWENLLDPAKGGGTKGWNPIFNHTQTTAPTGGTGSSIGYYNLTTGFQTLATLTDTGSYAANTVTLEGRTVDGTGGANGDNGRELEFRVTYADGHTNIFFDVVDGTITSNVELLKATGALTITSPAYSLIVSLTAGA
jgi:hypothetical protein